MKIVEIIPKPSAKSPFWLNILLYFSIALLLASVLSVFFLDQLKEKMTETMNGLENELSGKKNALASLEKDVLSAQRKIDDFSQILAQRLTPLNFFSFLEGFAHPKVQFTQLVLNPGEFRAGLSGFAESFETLGQQILIFEMAGEIKDVRLSKISVGREGGADFSLNLSLDPEIFK